MRGPVRGPGPAPYARPPPFDMIYAEEMFDRVNEVDEAPLTQELMACATRVAATAEQKSSATSLCARVKAAMEKMMSTSDLNIMKLEEACEVGSVKMDTALAAKCEADIVALSSILPTYETAIAFATKLSELMNGSPDYVTCIAKEYGCHVRSTDAQVHVLFTTLPCNASLIEKDLHLQEDTLRNNYVSVRHALWLESMAEHGPLKELIRVVKDVRNRFPALQHMDIWTTHFLCYFSIMQTPDHSPLALGPAFKRFFQLLSAGIFLPGGPPLVDPTEPNRFIGSGLSFEQMDALCCTAQTILRLIVNEGYGVVLGAATTTTEVDILNENTMCNGVVIRPSEAAYKPGCMDKPTSTTTPENSPQE